MTNREQFERWISSPPYEASIKRYPDDETGEPWPGQYWEYHVQLAWEAWNRRASGWIPTHDRLPENGQTVFIYDPGMTGPIESALFEDGSFWLDLGTVETNPTHWQPLPEPPQ